MASLTKVRSVNGQFPKGQSGNPGGRPRDEQKIAGLTLAYTRETIEALAELMRSGNNDRVRGTAAQALLDRGWGKPKVEVVSDGTDTYIEALRLINERLAIEEPTS